MNNGQPKALYYLLLTQLWSSFAFYAMISLFVLYLTGRMGFDDNDAFLTFGAYTSFTYFATVAGGIIADRLLGFRWCIVIGTVLMAVGYLALLGDSPWLIFLGLGVVVVGNGFVGSNVPAFLGAFYGDNDTRRDSGYTLFYMGINVGALGAMFLAGVVATQLGYKIAFAMCAVGMALSLVAFVAGRRHYAERGYLPAGSPVARGATRRPLIGSALIAASALAIVGSSLLIEYNRLDGEILAVLGIGLVGYFIYEMTKETAQARRKLYVYLILVFFAIVFNAIYSQTNASVVLFTERDVDLNLLGFAIPPSDIQSLNPLFILIFAPVLIAVWQRFAAAGREVSNPAKFALGLVFLGAGFVVLYVSVFAVDDDGAGLDWMVLFYLLYTIGELCVGPIGMAMAAALAPKRLAGFAMSLWMLSISLAYYLAGLISGLADIPEGTGTATSRSIYQNAFLDYGGASIAAAVALLVLVPWLKRLMRG